jgi:hypothetical protein
MVKVVVVTLLLVVELGLLKKYVPFRNGCPSAPSTVTRLLLLPLHAASAAFGQSPGLTTP